MSWFQVEAPLKTEGAAKFENNAFSLTPENMFFMNSAVPKALIRMFGSFEALFGATFAFRCTD